MIGEIRLKTQRTKTRIMSVPRILLALQAMILIGTIMNARASLTWIWSVLAFLPALAICLSFIENKYVVPSLVILFISQQAIFIFANPPWGFSFGSDQINDFHIASVMSEVTHFDLGKLGYSGRQAYSYYPMLHLFSVTLSKFSGIPLTYVALYFVPILNALLTTLVLFQLNHDLFELEGARRNLATLFFEMSFYYTAFDSQFVRETFAFPLVLLSIWIAVRIAKSQDQQYAVIAPIFFAAVVMSHQISSYLLLVILAVLALSFRLFHKNSRLNIPLLFMAVMIGSYTIFVVLSFSATQLIYAYEGFLAIFQREASTSILRFYDPLKRYLALIYYAVVSTFAAVGGIRLLREKKKNLVVITILSLFVLSFFVSVVLRFSTPADPWSWTYYMSLRGTVWAFIGISILLSLGFMYTFKINRHFSSNSFAIILMIVLLLAAGKFSQYGSIVSDPTVSPPVSYARYTGALWLQKDAVHGSRLLVAPYSLDNEAFEASRSMAPYAYLSEYFLDESKGRTYDRFSGYIPLIGGFFDQYSNQSNVQVIYSNGEVEIGYKKS